MEPFGLGAADGLTPFVLGQFIAALAFGFTIADSESIGAEAFDLAGREQRGGGLHFRFLAGNQSRAHALDQSDQRDAQNQDRDHDFDQREPAVLHHGVLYLDSASASGSAISTRPVTGFTRRIN